MAIFLLIHVQKSLSLSPQGKGKQTFVRSAENQLHKSCVSDEFNRIDSLAQAIDRKISYAVFVSESHEASGRIGGKAQTSSGGLSGAIRARITPRMEIIYFRRQIRPA